MFGAIARHHHVFEHPSLLQPSALPRLGPSPREHAPAPASTSASSSAFSDTLLSSPLGPSMAGSASDYSQTGLPSPYPSNFGDTRSEASSSVDPASAAQYSQQEVRSSNAYSTSATPTSAEYAQFPPSARPGTFSEGIHQRTYHPSSSHSGSSGMAQPPTNPTLAQTSPTYPYPQQSPYPGQDMSHGYGHNGSMYAQPRPDWGSYHGQAPPLTPGHPHNHVFPATPTSVSAPRGNQVYSFVPIPGAQQHKRPRRRYEEIERMYKCGWNGCEKAYGTLNHLNAHVTMQSHGAKRTPEEFKEIRKEWKARKKEEENQRKEDERQRQSQNNGDAAPGADGNQPPTSYAGARQVQLPPIGYAPGNQYPASSYGVPAENSPTGYMHPNSAYPPNSPYTQQPGQMYSQHNGGSNAQ